MGGKGGIGRFAVGLAVEKNAYSKLGGVRLLAIETCSS